MKAEVPENPLSVSSHVKAHWVEAVPFTLGTQEVAQVAKSRALSTVLSVL